MTKKRRDPKDYLPLTPSEFHVLLALAEGEKHGYAIHKDVLQQTDGRVGLSTGTLYAILRRLLSEGMIEKASRRPAPERDDERRRYYRLTRFGKEVAAGELAEMEKHLSTARARNLLDVTQHSQG